MWGGWMGTHTAHAVEHFRGQNMPEIMWTKHICGKVSQTAKMEASKVKVEREEVAEEEDD